MGDDRDELTLPLAEDTAPGREIAQGAPALGSRVGRYILTEELGRGGMGTVYGAHDPELQRAVAIKVLHRPWPGDGSRELRSRLRREAQALARLSHPNVVAVYEVGEHDDSVFVAMERIDGVTLDRWLRTPRRTGEILDTFIAAGRGLAAAHAEGLVHRDFKPSNVIVPHDERVRVLDFGLARGVHELASSGDGSETPRSEELEVSFSSASMSGLLAEKLTAEGTVMGTPSYMAPEQLHGKGCDARADQYAFCVALYEALYQQMPFEGRRIKALAKAKERGKLRPRPRGVGPRGVWPIIARGLSPRPEDRWGSMHELLEQVERVRHPLRSRALFGAAGLGLAGAVAAVWTAGTHSGPRCEDAAAVLDGVWDDARRRELATSIANTGVAWAEATTAGVSNELDAYTRSWAELRRSTCEAARAEALPARELDSRMHCLDDQLGRVKAVVDVLGDADVAATRRAIRMVADLPPPQDCEASTIAAAPSDPELAARVREIELSLIELQALVDAGRFKDAEPRVAATLLRTRAMGHSQLTAKALWVAADLAAENGEWERSVELHEEAFWRAQEAGDDVVAAGVAARLVYMVGDRFSRFDEAMRWARHGEGLLERIGKHPGVEGSLRAAIGTVLHKQGKTAEAIEQLERVLALRVEQHGREHHDVAAVLTNLGNARLDQAELEEAKRNFEEALVIRERLFGSNHPDVAEGLASLGSAYMSAGHHETARRYYERAYARGRVALGDDHPLTVAMLTNVAIASEQTGNYDKAAEYFEKAVASFEEQFGPDHTNVATAMHGLGGVRRIQGRYDDAVSLLERSLAIFEGQLGPEHPNVAVSRINLGLALVQHGSPAKAIEHFERSIEIATKAWGSGHPDVAKGHHMLGFAYLAAGDAKRAMQEQQQSLELWRASLGTDHAEYVVTLTALGEAQLESGFPLEAIETLREAVALADRVEIASDGRAATWLALAQALKAQSPRSTEAKTLARRALSAFEAADAPFEESRAAAKDVLGS